MLLKQLWVLLQTYITISMVLKSFIERARQFFEDFGKFMQKEHQNIAHYYTQGTEFPKSSFDKLDLLIISSGEIKQKIKDHRDSFNNLYLFEIVDQFEICSSMLDFISNYSKWYQSTSIKGRYQSTSQVSSVLRQNETLENFSTRVGYANGEEGSLDIALKNHIKEEDYSFEGGLVMETSTQIDNGSLVLNTVVDELVGENILGRDIQQKLSFSEDDIVCLTPQETFEQTVRLICKLFKGNNPEFPSSGLDKSFLSNKNGLCIMLPTVMRQLNEIVSTEDTIRNFSIKSIDNRGDVMKIDLEFESVLSNQISQTIDGN